METTGAKFISMIVERIEELEKLCDTLRTERDVRIERLSERLEEVDKFVMKPQGRIYHQNNRGNGSHYRIFLDPTEENADLKEDNDIFYLQKMAENLADFPEISHDDIDIYGTGLFKCIVIKSDSILPHAYISHFVRSSIDIDELGLTMKVKLYN